MNAYDSSHVLLEMSDLLIILSSLAVNVTHSLLVGNGDLKQ